MSETDPSRKPVEARLANDMAAAIEGPWSDFEAMAASPALQEFSAFESRYKGILDDEQKPDVTLKHLAFEPAAEQFAAHEVASFVSEADERVDAFLQFILTAHAERKRKPVSELQDAQAAAPIISRVLVGGVDKVFDHLDYGTSENNIGDRLDQFTYLPVTLLMLGAKLSSAKLYEEVAPDVIEPTVGQAEIDQTIDDTLQQACQKVANNEKLPLPKGAGQEADRIFAASMNCLRTMYHQGKDRGFIDSVISTFYEPLRASSYDYYIGGGDPDHDHRQSSYDWDGIVRESYANIMERLNPTLGANITYPGPIEGRSKLTVYQLRHEKLKEQGLERIGFNALFRKMYSTHAARHFVDAIASGRIKYSEINQAVMHLRQQPLSGYESPTPDLEKVWVNWEMLPPSTGSGEPGNAPRTKMDSSPNEPRERDIDWLRISKLVSFAEGWGGSVSFARTRIPDLPDDKQYYAVILPEVQPDGSVIEHAVADYPEINHGLYVWRGEFGWIVRNQLELPAGVENPDGNLTWKEVLARRRMVARRLGARCFHHTKNIETNVLDYLTLPTDKLTLRRYAGGGALGIARRAQ